MRITSIRIQGYRAFADSGVITLDQLNVLIGANNAGKSSILKAIHLIQEGNTGTLMDVRVDSNIANIELEFANVQNVPRWGVGPGSENCQLHISYTTTDRKNGSSGLILYRGGTSYSGGHYALPNVDPYHFVVPFLSRRKTAGYGEDVRESNAMTMHLDMSNLAAKLSRVSNPQFPTYEQYARSSKDILGFVVTNIPSPNGQRPGIYLPSQETLPIDQLGEGVPNIVQMLVNLTSSKGKIFLIEEPENDLHPQALKALLDLIIASSNDNQFVISTHSNIVVTYLGSAPGSKIFKVSAPRGQLPVAATIETIEPEPSARIATLVELGYAFSDMGLWEGWLLLEESSAETIIRNYLIPMFAPKLKSIRTLSAGGLGNVEPSFSELNRLALFVHLQPAYLQRTWVRVDGDTGGIDLIRRLKERYTTWPTGAFQTFSKPQFELYYPSSFQEDVEAALSKIDPRSKRIAKRELLQQVMAWLDADAQRARTALEASAAEVIADLREIEECVSSCS